MDGGVTASYTAPASSMPRSDPPAGVSDDRGRVTAGRQWNQSALVATKAVTFPNTGPRDNSLLGASRWLRTSPDRLRSAVVAEYIVRALDESTWPAFAALVEDNNGVFGGCWCMGFHEDARGTEPPKRERKLARVRAGTAHAALVFDGDNCLGWCQFGAPDEVPRIKNRAAYEKGLTVLPDWRIACNFVGKGHRRHGVATAALAGALDLIADLGGGRVEGYPEDAGSVPAGFLYHGALSTYESLGFVRDRKIGKHRWVVAKVVEPKP